MAAILKGVTCKYGITGTESSLKVQAYSITSDFQNVQTVVDQNGKTITVRYDDRKSVIKVDGIAVTESIPELGATFNFTVNTESSYDGGASNSSFTGVVTAVNDNGASKNWTNISITAECYEGVSYS